MNESRDIEAEAAVHAFLARFGADQAAGDVASLDTYQRRWPGHEATIAAEYAALTAAASEGAPGSHLGPYRIEEEIGRGAQGVVYRAVDERLDRVVALKVLPPQVAGDARTRLRFQREARAAARLDHPGIATVYESGRADGVTYIAMRHVSGETLAARIARAGAPPTGAALTEALALVAEVARAVHAAHEQRVLHRDLKPGNVMVGRDGAPVVLDFGLAGGAGAGVPLLTATGDVFGTPAYMAPEQLRPDDTTPGPRADVYALGVILYEVVTGERPYAATTLADLYRAILDHDVRDPRDLNPQVPRDLAVVLETALAHAPDERYESAAALADDLGRVARGEPIHARPAPAWLRLWRWSERNRLLATSIAGLFLVITTALVIVSSMLSSYRVGEATQQAREIDDLLRRGFQRTFGVTTRGARAPFERILALDPTHREALVGRVLVELPAAEAAFARAAAAPTTDLGTFLEGQAAVEGFQPPVTEAEARAGLTRFRAAALQAPRPRFHHFHAWMMAAHHAVDADALAEAERALVHHWPDSQATWEAVAQFAYARDRRKALDAMRRILALGPSASAHLGLGSDALERGARDDALRHFDAAVADDPEAASAHWMRARLLADLGRPVEAARAYAAAVRTAEPFFLPTARASFEAALEALAPEAAAAIRREVGSPPEAAR